MPTRFPALVLCLSLLIPPAASAAAAPAAGAVVAPRPLRVAVVGAGPAGLFAAEALLARPDLAVTVDVFDRRPAPLGLVRAGVAPDHQESKALTGRFEKVADNPFFRFFGNVSVGKDVTHADLTRHYDRIIYATGSPLSRKLGISGEDLEGVHDVGSFVGWYNGDSGAAGVDFDLARKRVVVIGGGPVGLDAARVLVKDPQRLAVTDISDRALQALQGDAVESVRLIDRNPADDPRHSQAFKQEVLDHDRDGKVAFQYQAEPVEIVGEGGRVTGVKVRGADGKVTLVPADLVLRSVGFRGEPVAGLPFDPARAVIPSAEGRVLDLEKGVPVPGTYVAGWAKNGARSLIGAQRADAQAAVDALIQDSLGTALKADPAKAVPAIVETLRKRGVRFLSKENWSVIDALERQAGMFAGKPRVKFAGADEMAAALEKTPTPRSTQGPLYVMEDGVKVPLGYNPALPVTPLWRTVLDFVLHLPSKLKAYREYMRRVDQSLKEITDADLAWSLGRFDLLQNQEGILRQSNRDLVHNWRPWTGANLPLVSPDDFEGASLSRISIRKIFQQAMDREEPTRSYQYTSAMNLHNFMPRVAHFMGISMQERVAAVALTGRAPEHSVWAQEEERHHAVMEAVYNLSREPGQPALHAQGIAQTDPRPGEKSMRTMIASRSLAEIGAASGYLLLKSNAKKGSPADLALEGIFRDEVYHYVLMNAARKWGLGITGRWARLFDMLRYQFGPGLPKATDEAKHERKGFSPAVVFQVVYAFLAIDKRVEDYLKTVPDAVGVDFVGKVYRTEPEVREAIARGEHTWTDAFPIELNPEVSVADLEEWQRRFPGRFSMDDRRLKSEQILGMIANYRTNLSSPGYWLRRKGFAEAGRGPDGSTRLRRTAGEGASAAVFDLTFPASGEPLMAVRAGGRLLYDGTVAGLSMLRLGRIFAASSADDLAGWDGLAEDLSPREIVRRLLNSPSYQSEPIPLDDDPAPAPASRRRAAVEQAPERGLIEGERAPDAVAAPYKVYMCTTCGYTYDEAKGEALGSVPLAPGTRWADVPDNWVCPTCGDSKAAFEEDMVEVPRAAVPGEAVPAESAGVPLVARRRE